ncbi:MAG TPA: hypothetical protein VLX12_05100 [Syntrophorhabdales bacterium]|nr:hypothetical protein [Syntrophorhabdales bacterium]
MKTMSKKKVYLSIIGLVVMVMLAGCASSSGGKPQQTPPGSSAPGPTTGKEPLAPGSPQPRPTGPASIKPKPAPETPYSVHTVKWRGETVSIIAGWYTGDIQNWKVLKEYNPDINSNRIFEGNKIRIPEYMMKTKAPMTKEYVDSFYTKSPRKESGKAAPPSAPSTDKGDEPTLFGPK